MATQDEKKEQRRLALKALVDQLGHGGIAAVARAINMDASYVSRLLYPTGKGSAKGIGETVADRIEAAFPGWLQGRAQITKTLPAAQVVSLAVDNAAAAGVGRQLSLDVGVSSGGTGDELMVAYATASAAKKEIVRAALLGYDASGLVSDDPLAMSALYAAEKRVEDYIEKAKGAAVKVSA